MAKHYEKNRQRHRRLSQTHRTINQSAKAKAERRWLTCPQCGIVKIKDRCEDERPREAA